MPTVGSNGGLSGNVMAGLVDRFGVPVISTGNEFGDEQIGYAIRSGLLFGVQNATFDYTPPDPTVEIQNSSNPLPFWQIDNASNGADGLPQIAGSAIFDSTTGTWGININPGTAAAGATYTLRTRSFVLNDDNLQLRQKAFATLAKVGTYSGSSQWNCVLRAIYWAHSGSAIGTTTIGTVYDNTTWTGISGYTTSGGSAFSSTADSVDLEFIFTTTATVSSSTSLTIKSLLLTTSSATTGSFIVTDTYTASGTWARPAGVTNLIAVMGVGGGGGGIGGAIDAIATTAVGNTTSGSGGGSSSWAMIRDLYVGDVTTVTVGVGTAGLGGPGTTFTKGAGSSAGTSNANGGVAGNGGATTFGSYFSIPGGGGATGYSAGSLGAAGSAPTSTVYGFTFLGAVAGVLQTNAGASGSASAYSSLPYWASFAAGSAGANGVSTGASTNVNGTASAAGSAGIIGGGNGGARLSLSGSTWTTTPGLASGNGSGGAGGPAACQISGTVTAILTGGSAGASAPNSGAGGSGGGGVRNGNSSASNYTASTLTMTSGAGAAGGAGRLYVVYVA